MSAPATTPRDRLRGFGFLGITAFAWGLNWPVMKAIMQDWPPYTVRIFALGMACTVMMSVARFRGDRILPRRNEWSRLVLFGVLNVSSWSVAATLAFFWLDASEAAIIAYTIPVWTTLLAWPVLGDRPNAGRILGLVLGLSGVLLLLGGTLRAQGWDALVGKLPGVAAILCTAVMFALGSVLTKRNPVPMAPFPLIAWQLLFGAVPVWVIALSFESLDVSRVTWVGWVCLFYLGLAAQCVAYFSWFAALRLLPAGVAATGNLMVPVVGVLSSALLLGEPVGLRHVLALALTLGGVVLAARS